MMDGFPRSFGPYELLRPLGRGGMAEVFLAQAPSARGDARLVALKRMHAGVGEDSGAVEMLVAEARLAMRFDHPNIAATFELGCHEEAWYFLMEYVDGLDLGAVARLAESLEERMAPAAAALVGLGVARGLQHAHDLADESGTPLGVVHRDVSPQNILINRRGVPKLIDFGVAKVATRIQQTMAGVIKGKYAYMSPEQATAEKLDGRSDLFSLGICLHEWLTGQPLFRGPNMVSPFAILRAVREEPIADVHALAPDVGAELAAIVARCLARDVTERWSSAAELADALEQWLARNAPGFDERSLRTYVDDLVQRAPSDSLPQRAIATPPLSKMDRQEFAPSALSVVAQSPLEAASQRTQAPSLDLAPRPGTEAPTALHDAIVPRPAAPPPVRSAVPAAPRHAAGGDSAAPVPAPQGAVARRSKRPRRRTVLQFLWVGLAALVFALGWSVVATLKRFGAL